MTIRELIIQKRNESNMTQKELSEKTGIPQSRISDFESGKRNMNSDNIDKMLAALEVSFNQNKSQMWDLAKTCAKILKNKGVASVMNLTKEEVSTLTGKDEILIMKEYDEKLYDELSAKMIANEQAYNYMQTLIEFHLALIK